MIGSYCDFLNRLFLNVMLLCVVGGTGTLNARQELSLKIELESDVLDYDEPLTVKLTNESMRPVLIPNPHSYQGYGQLSFQMVDEQDGTVFLVQKSPMNERLWNNEFHGYEPVLPTVEIPVNDHLVMTVCFSEFDYAYAERLWNNLPDPDTGRRFGITAQLKTENEGAIPSSDDVWRGSIESEQISAKLTFPRLETPSDYLRNHFAGKAMEVLKANPESVNTPDDSGDTPLHIVAESGDVEIVKWLLENGADINVESWNGPPLHYARNPETIDLILARKPDLSIPTSGRSSLQQIARMFAEASSPEEAQRCREIADRYLKAGAEYDLPSAIYLNNLEQVEAIIRDKPALAHQENYISPLWLAAKLGRLEICQFLVNECQVNVADDHGSVIVAEAVAYPDIVKLLAEHGAELNYTLPPAPRNKGPYELESILHVAAYSGRPETIIYLIDQGVDMFSLTKSMDGSTESPYSPIEAAAGATANPEALNNLRAFLDHPEFQSADEDIRQRILDKCLYQIIFSGRSGDVEVQMFRMLLERGANPNGSGDRPTPIQTIATNLDPERIEYDQWEQIIRVFQESGAKLDLVTAAAIGDAQAVAGFLKEDPESAKACRFDGTPALHIAAELNHPQVVRQLLDAGCDPDSRCQHGQTALHEAGYYGRFDIAKMLLESGADVNARDQGGETPLHKAALLGNLRTLRVLLDRGADVHARSDQGMRAQDLDDTPEVTRVFSDFADNVNKHK